MIHDELERYRLLRGDRFLKLEHRDMILADGSGNCPARVLIRINGVGNGVAVLVEVRQSDSVSLTGSPFDSTVKLLSTKLPLLARPGTLARQSVVSENLQHDGGDLRNRSGIAFEGVGCFFRICAGDERNILAVGLDRCVAVCRG